jgi:hypothetical protein
MSPLGKQEKEDNQNDASSQLVGLGIFNQNHN